jgi:hypothetical protein
MAPALLKQPGARQQEREPLMRTNRNADDRVQRAVLGLVLDESPTLLTPGDLAMEVGPQDAVGRAVRDLTAVGLLRGEGDSVLPTRAAVHFDRLCA